MLGLSPFKARVIWLSHALDVGIAPEVYLHVSNGGVTFKVKDDPKWGPAIEISQSQFGAVQNELVILTDPASLGELAGLFQAAAEYPWPVGPVAEQAARGQVADPWDDVPRAQKRAAAERVADAWLARSRGY